MTRPVADRVKVAWTGTGTGTMTLDAAIANFQGFPASLNGQIVGYSIEHTTDTQAEAGFGTYSSATNTLTRTYRTYPTLGGAAVNFTGGVKHVRLTALGLDLYENRATSDPGVNDDVLSGYIEGRSRWLNTSTNTLWFCVDHAAGAAVWIECSGGAPGGAVDVQGTPTAGQYTRWVDSNTLEGVALVSPGAGNSLTDPKFWKGTQAAYDALTPDANTIYFIV